MQTAPPTPRLFQSRSAIANSTEFSRSFIMLCEHCGKIFSSKSAYNRHKKESCIGKPSTGNKRKCEYNITEAAKIPKTIECKNHPSKSEVAKITEPTENKDHPDTSKATKVHSTDCKYQPSTSEVPKIGKQRLNQPCTPQSDGVEKITSAFKSRICSYRFSTKKFQIDHNDFFEEIANNVKSIVKKYLQQFIALKINVELFSIYAKPETDATETKSFNTKNEVITQSTNLDDVFDQFKQDVITKAGNFNERGSGK